VSAALVVVAAIVPAQAEARHTWIGGHVTDSDGNAETITGSGTFTAP